MAAGATSPAPERSSRSVSPRRRSTAVPYTDNHDVNTVTMSADVDILLPDSRPNVTTMQQAIAKLRHFAKLSRPGRRRRRGPACGAIRLALSPRRFVRFLRRAVKWRSAVRSTGTRLGSSAISAWVLSHR